MNSQSRLVHPGKAVEPRRSIVCGRAVSASIDVHEGETLATAIARELIHLGADSALIKLDGLEARPLFYVQPAISKTPSHAAWYSAEHRTDTAVIDHGTAMIGWRDGVPFAHCHAVWHAGKQTLGHLLPDKVLISRTARLKGWAFFGGRFESRDDPETNFRLFNPEPVNQEGALNAAIVTLRPHEDIASALTDIVDRLDFGLAHVEGLGSLIGARFKSTPEMTSPISEMLLLSGAKVTAKGAHLPLICIDTHGQLFSGKIMQDGGAVCVTAEFLVMQATVS